MEFFFRFIVLPVLLFYVARAILRSIVQGFHSTFTPPDATRQPPSVRSGGELKKDPVCGTYVSTATSIARTVNGEVLYFCSQECRDKYRAV
jgi:YHS domain-containing protein